MVQYIVVYLNFVYEQMDAWFLIYKFTIQFLLSKLTMENKFL